MRKNRELFTVLNDMKQSKGGKNEKLAMEERRMREEQGG